MQQRVVQRQHCTATIIPNGVQTLQPLKISALKEYVLASMGILWYT